MAIETRKTQILMNKPVYIRLSILDLSKKSNYGFRYDYKYGEKEQFFYDNTESFIVYIKTNDIC